VKALGKLEDAEDVDDAIMPALCEWTELLTYDFESVSRLNKDGRQRFVPQRLRVWGALDLAMELLEAAACQHVVRELPGLVPIVLSHACAPQSGAGGCRAPAARHLDTVQWRALSCLGNLLRKMDYQLWESTSYDPTIVVDDLITQAFHTSAEHLQKKIMELLDLMLMSLQPYSEAVMEKLRRRVLFFLLRQVPSSRNFGSLANGIAKKQAFHIMWQALSTGLPAVSASHIYGPALVEGLTQPRTIAHMEAHSLAVKLVEATLRGDAAVLACSNMSWAIPDCQEVLDDEDCIVSLALDNRESWRCCPALWQGVACHSSARIAVALIGAAADLAFTAARAADNRPDSVPGGWCQDGLTAPHAVERARRWDPTSADWADDSNPNSLLVKDFAPELLEEFRTAICIQLEHMARMLPLRLEPAGMTGGYTQSEAVSIHKDLLILSVGLDHRMAKACQTCLMATTHSSTLSDALRGMVQHAGVGTAVPAAIDTVLQIWSHGNSFASASQGTWFAMATTLTSFFRLAARAIMNYGEGLGKDGIRTVERMHEFSTEAMCAANALATRCPSEHNMQARGTSAASSLQLELFSFVTECIDGSNAVTLRLDHCASLRALVDWAAQNSRQESKVSAAWGKAILSSVNAQKPAGIDQMLLASMKNVVRTSKSIPDSTKVALGSLLPDLMPGSLGMGILDSLPSFQPFNAGTSRVWHRRPCPWSSDVGPNNKVAVDTCLRHLYDFGRRYRRGGRVAVMMTRMMWSLWKSRPQK